MNGNSVSEGVRLQTVKKYKYFIGALLGYGILVSKGKNPIFLNQSIHQSMREDY